MNEDTSGKSLEIEVKFLISDLGELRDRLLKEGAILQIPRTYEHNILFDNAWQGLARQGKLLRVRQDAVARVTFKGSSKHQINSEVRVREEIEVGVDDFDRTVAILEHIGFEKKQRYEKYRETYSFRDIEIVLDEMPFGDFVELEGAEVGIRTAAAVLQLDWNKRIVDNYLALSARLKAHYKLSFDDITFDDYAKSDISGAAVILEGQL
jgi:adenylate cyclase class 2